MATKDLRQCVVRVWGKELERELRIRESAGAAVEHVDPAEVQILARHGHREVIEALVVEVSPGQGLPQPSPEG
jgi:hypothetical protein